jgi:D-threo-aldose 1-dehydrogenase
MSTPVPAFGGYLNLFAAISDDEAIALVRHAWARGIRHFDTAPHYGSGLSERRIGTALRGGRAIFTLSTMVGRPTGPAPARPAWVRECRL